MTCTVCPRSCLLRPGQKGFCRARINNGTAIVPLARNHPCAVCADPVEKKPLYHFFPGASILSLGTAGCNLRCRNCQNAFISQAGPDERPWQELPPESLPGIMRRHGLRLAAYTYTEPLVALEYVTDCAARVREAGGYNALVTAAYVQKHALDRILPFIDAANVDLKAMSDSFYRTNCSASLSPVLDALVSFAAAGICLEVTNLVIPGLNDSDGDIRKLVGFVRDELGAAVPLHFSRFFPCHELAHLAPTPDATLLRARDMAHDAGLKHVYLGNTSHPEITFCAACHAELIVRTGFHVTRNRLDATGRCPACGEPLYGRF